ncbi:MAG: DUF433 domain-containing protein [Ignavibacteriaceae bacterium]|nr:DUF433 domain-containing protein [Ignavibacteriaceae bacterium]
MGKEKTEIVIDYLCKLFCKKRGLKIDLMQRITINRDILVGKPTIRGLRISVDQIIKALAAGLTQEEILEDYPELEKDDIKAALLYASKVLESERIFTINA